MPKRSYRGRRVFSQGQLDAIKAQGDSGMAPSPVQETDEMSGASRPPQAAETPGNRGYSSDSVGGG